MTCSEAVCFQNMEIRVLCEGVPGQVAVKASGIGASERPPIKGCNDVAVDWFDQACRLAVLLNTKQGHGGLGGGKPRRPSPRFAAPAAGRN
jgi:hypothetical protein